MTKLTRAHPSKAELEADLHIDMTPEELRQALVRPVVMQPEA